MRHIIFFLRVALGACAGISSLVFAAPEQQAVDESAVRAIVAKTPNSVTFGPAAFGGTNNFFVGAQTPPGTDATYALSRVSLNRDDNNLWNVQFNPLAPATGVTINNGTKQQASPLKNQAFTQVGLLAGTLPIVVTPANAMSYLPNNNNTPIGFEVALLNDTTTGNKVYSNAALRDGNSTILQNSERCAALAASDDTIFVAFSPANGTFGQPYSGISRLQKDPADNVLRTIKLDGSGRGMASAYEIFVNGGTNTPAAFLAKPFTRYSPLTQGVYFAAYDGTNDPQPKLGHLADMYWDPVLERLYIGLTGATGNQAKPAAIQSLLVGRIDTTPIPATNTLGTLRVEPALALSASFGYPAAGDGLLGVGDPETKDSIIGFNSITANSLQADTYKVRTMHTSTGKSYVIVNGGVISAEGSGDQTLIYALPLATQDPNPNNNGFIADDLFQNSTGTATTNARRTDPATGTYASYPRADVGTGLSNFGFISGSQTQPLTDMRVVGDTVYASVTGTRNANRTEEEGIFSSTAIFNEKGAVRAWTPWQRVGGTQNIDLQNNGIFDSVAQFGFDENSQNVWFLDGDDNKSVRVSQWWIGDATIHRNSPLSVALANFFDNGGVTNLVAFDGATPGFQQATLGHPHDYFSMMVATGYGRVAMIQTGQNGANATSVENIFTPVAQFLSAEVIQGQNVENDPAVYIFSSDSNTNSLPNLGQVIAAEVARSPAGYDDDAGWLFVGGQNGLAVLRSNIDGTGWNNTTGNGLSTLSGGVDADYPGGKNFAWQLLIGPNGEQFNDVRKIVADGLRGFVYVLTRTQLIRIAPYKAAMKSGILQAPNSFVVMLDLQAGTLAGGSFGGGYIPVGSSAMSTNATNYATTNRAFSLQSMVDELFDVMLLETDFTSGPNSSRLSKIALATTRGVIISNLFDNPADGVFNGPASATNPNSIFFQLPAAFGGGDLILGPALRFDFVNTLRGGQLNQPVTDVSKYFAEGNLYVTAYDQALTNLSVYRFNVTNSTMLAFNEPYEDASGAQTPYFYKIGDISSSGRQYVNPQGPADFIATKADFGDIFNGFSAAIPSVPNSAAYQQLTPPLSAEAVSLGRTFDGAPDLNTITVDPASGAKYIFGQFGVVVNE